MPTRSRQHLHVAGPHGVEADSSAYSSQAEREIAGECMAEALASVRAKSSTATLTQNMRDPVNPYVYYERGGHTRAVELVRERFPDNMQALIIGSLAIDDIMFPTKDREDKALTIPEAVSDDQLEAWLLEQAVQAVANAPEVPRG